MITSEQLRTKFLEFFQKKGHKVLPSSSLIPENDPSVLLTTAGMQQFKRWFSGIESADYARVTTSQKCVRIGDIEEVGDDTHFSFFEMLGNFSFGGQNESYFKEESLKLGIDFIKNELNIDFSRVSFTYFKGDKETPADKESLEILQKLDIPKEKIKPMGRDDNFWGPTGEEGPCGPTVEIYVDGVEIWNHVFNEFYKKDNKFTALKNKGVDTGAGLERVLSVLNNAKSPYETDLFSEILTKINSLAANDNKNSQRIVADHIKTAVFLLADGVLPSNLDKGYVLRRLIRRAIRHGKILEINKNFTTEIAKEVIKKMHKIYPELKQNEQFICSELRKEEEKFSLTLERGIKQFENLAKSTKLFTGKMVFDLFQTYGFPLEMTEELAIEKGIKIDKQGFEKEFTKHQELSRKGAEAKFKGGLAGTGEMETKYHTATHLLHKALQIVLGDHAKQSGSNITAERLRFDFTHPEKMTEEQIQETEKLVNEQIKAKLPVTLEVMSVKEARELGALGLFESKYGNEVKVYTIGDSKKPFSVEICGGPHVKNTGELGTFKITKEESSSAGTRRIKAVLTSSNK